MPYTADFRLIDFEIERADESRGDEPYLIAVYWALDGNISLDGASLAGTPQLVFRGGDHENIVSRSIRAGEDPVPIPSAVGEASIRVQDFGPTLPGATPTVGCTVVAFEEDNTPDHLVNTVMEHVRTGIPSFAAEFVSGLTVLSVVTPAAMASTVADFERQMRNEILSIATSVGARHVGRTLLWGLFGIADKDDEVGQATARLTASATRPRTSTTRLVLERQGSGGAGSSSPSARYIVNASISIAPAPASGTPIFVDIDFFGRDDDRTDEIHNPGPTSFPIEPGRAVSRSFRWGGEMRVEYDFSAERNSGGDVFLTVNGRLFEGTHELNEDLDGTGSMQVAARSGTRNSSTLTINNGERRSNDMGELAVTLRNGV